MENCAHYHHDLFADGARVVSESLAWFEYQPNRRHPPVLQDEERKQYSVFHKPPVANRLDTKRHVSVTSVSVFIYRTCMNVSHMECSTNACHGSNTKKKKGEKKKHNDS